MTSAPYRMYETATVPALHDLEILNTGAEPKFDALVEAAAVVCEAPMALISPVDLDRQWFQARLDFAGPRTPHGI